MMLSFLCVEEELVEEVICVIGKDDKKYFAKEGKILETALGFRCALCCYRVFLNLRLVLQVSVEVVLKSLS